MSVASEVKDVLDPFLGDRVFDAKAPDGTKLPFAVMLPEVATSRALSGDGRAMAWRDLFQVDLWEAYEEESRELRDDVIRALDGLKLEAGLRLMVTDSQRVPDPDEALVHRAITCSLVRLG